MGRPAQRPDLLKIPVAYKLPRWLVEWMREQPEAMSIQIERALTQTHNLSPPEVSHEDQDRD
jgi:hypothetical protein